MKAVIMAGGKGTRLSSVTNDEIPKPMVRLNGKPILEYQIEVLKKNGICEFILIVGYLHQVIKEYFGDGKKYGVSIEYIIEEKPMGSAGALFYLKEKIKDTFLLVFGDLIFDISVKKFLSFHNEHNSDVSLLVHPNGHPFDSDLVILDNSQRVIRIDSKLNQRNYYYSNCVNAGIYLLNMNVISELISETKLDLEKDIIIPSINNNRNVFGYKSPEYVRDVGTPTRLFDTEQDIIHEIVKQKCLQNKQKCVFLDRDGTINKYVGLLTNSDQFELEDKVCEAINHMHKNGYLIIIITNQPVVARNLCSIKDVVDIHNKMETIMGEKGTYVDGISFCPHHPDSGYPEENKEYKITCNCRKPKTGMIEKWITDYNISQEESWMIGDSTIDIQTGKNAGLRTILLKTGMAGNDKKYEVIPNYISEDLMIAAHYITKEVANGL